MSPRHEDTMITPNILPLVDVLLVLVVILLLMAPFMAASIQVSIPKASGGAIAAGAALKIEMASDSSLMLDGKAATQVEIIVRAKTSGQSIQLYADRVTPYVFIAEFLGKLAAEDVTQVQLMVGGTPK